VPITEDEIKNIHIAVFALHELGGAGGRVHTEEIAKRCKELSPDRFKWRYYDYPEKELVRKALFHASEEANGGLVVGRAGMDQRGKEPDGWELTPTGAKWVVEHEAELAELLGRPQPEIPRHEAEKFKKRMHGETAFKEFERTGTVEKMTDYDFTDLLRCSPDAHVQVIWQKFNALYAQARMAKDNQVLGFLEACKRKFGHLMATKEATP
jgi:hypothetical protein